MEGLPDQAGSLGTGGGSWSRESTAQQPFCTGASGTVPGPTPNEVVKSVSRADRSEWLDRAMEREQLDEAKGHETAW